MLAKGAPGQNELIHVVPVTSTSYFFFQETLHELFISDNSNDKVDTSLFQCQK